MYEKIEFQNNLDYNAQTMFEQQLAEHKEMADTFNKVEMPKIYKIAEWHQKSEDNELIPNVFREILLGWYFSNPGLASNWINKESNSID
jgi:hypothetical protein|tara:strand:+ start:35 stop:301 length:267 start_codon:yes stop_codon:yes gene_type:complete